jgi:hypothetical protein
MTMSLTYASEGVRFNERGDNLGKKFKHAYQAVSFHDSKGIPFKLQDGQMSNSRFYDSSGAFLVGELERLDMTLHMPLAAVSWGRDIDLREDVTIGDEVSSFTLSTFGSPGGLGTGNRTGTGKAWIGKDTTQITNISVDIAKIVHDLRPWGLELKYTILELESAAQIGRPVDNQKFEGLKLKHQMDIDEQVYYGDTATKDTGLINSDLVTNINNLPNGAGAPVSPHWSTKSADEILSDVNFALTSVWSASAWAVIPSRLLLPPTQFGLISTMKVSAAGNVSVLRYVQENNLLTTSGRGKLDILPAKWLVGAGVGGTIGTAGTVDRMVVYTKEKDYIRYPMTPLQRTPLQYDGIYQKTTYYCRLGVVEVVYPETIGYFDGL